MSSDVNRIAIRKWIDRRAIREPGMEHPLLTDAGGRLSGAFPNGVVPSGT